ncbi:hypothetical protein NE237_005360 [Protea cynaroides]|uniref:Uncharacterized protein n=1 Tax=Protea cynaroides TaxID=273540 RepID=A0A9Q0KL80_9MAGN|nr:hypothetical protein NE237_005360 [Protea cynaroides]
MQLTANAKKTVQQVNISNDRCINIFQHQTDDTYHRMGALNSKKLYSICRHSFTGTPFGDELLLRALGFARAILLCWVLGRCVLPTACKPSALGRGRGVGNQGYGRG